MAHHARRRPRALAGLPLLGVERPPVGSLVDDEVVQDESAGLAHNLGALVVPHEVLARALRAGVDDFDLFHNPRLPTHGAANLESGVI